MKLYENSDSMAGITSFEFVEFDKFVDSTWITIMVGSYDEYLRIYRLEYTLENCNDSIQIESSSMIYKIHIEGGGIWRMKTFVSYEPSTTVTLLSAMYSGAYLLWFDEQTFHSEDSIKNCQKSCKHIRKLELPSISDDRTEQRLIYGINSKPDLSLILLSAFYNNELHRFKIY